MKKMKGFRTLVALMLTVMMVFSTAAVFAEVEVYDVGDILVDPTTSGNVISYGTDESKYKSVDITGFDFDKVVEINAYEIKNDGDYSNVAINIYGNDGTIDIAVEKNIESKTNDGIRVDSNNTNGIVSVTGTSDDLLEIIGRDDGVEIQYNKGKIDIDANYIKGQNGDGIHIRSDYSVAASNASTGEITFDVGDVVCANDGIEIQSNAGTVNIDQKAGSTENSVTTIQGYNDGISINNNSGTITSNQGQDSTPGDVKGTGDDSDGILINGNAEGGVIDLTHNNVTGKQDGIEIQANAGKIDIDANNVKGTNGDGIHIGPADPDSDDVSNTGTGTITFDVGNVSGKNDGIEIQNNAGTVNINQKAGSTDGSVTTVSGINTGLRIRNNTGEINTNQSDDATPGDAVGVEIDGNTRKGIITLTHNEIGTVIIYDNAGSVGMDANDIEGDIDISGNSGTIDIDTESMNGRIYIDPENSNNHNTSNIGSITIDMGEGKLDTIEVVKNAGTIEINKNNANSGNIEVNGMYGISVIENAGIMSINAGTVKGGLSGIRINDSTSDSEINIQTKKIEGEEGIELESNQGRITINEGQKPEEAGDVIGGIGIKGNEAVLNITAGTITGDVGILYKKSTAANEVTLNADKIIGDTREGIFVDEDQGKFTVTANSISGLEGITVDNMVSTGDFSLVADVAEGVSGTQAGIVVWGGAYKTNVSINGKVSAEGDGGVEKSVVGISSGGTKNTIEAGEVSATVTGESGSAFGLNNVAGTVIIQADKESGTTGNVTASADDVSEGTAVGICAFRDSAILISGDVRATAGSDGKATGLLLNDKDNNSDVVVEGTLYGDTAAITLDDSFAGNADVAVWKLDTGADGTLVSGNDANVSFAAAINYIVKVAKSAASLLTISGTEKTMTIGEGEEAENLSWQTAKAGEDVTVTLDLDEDEALDSLYYYYDDEKKEGTGQLTIANGGLKAVANAINTFKVTMQEAGGMLLGLTSHKHDFSVKLSTVTEPGCTTTGLDLYQCSKCDATKQVTVKAKGHIEVPDDAVEATCTKTGLTAGSHCSACGEVLKAQEVVKAKGHTEVPDDAVEATCTKTGLTAGFHCSACGEVLKAQEVVKAKGHTEVPDDAVEATCTKTGLTAGSHCSACGEVLKAQEVVKAKGHTEVPDDAVEATCTKTGLTAGSHCSVCGDVLVTQEVVKAKGHTEVTDAAVAATCTTAGKTAGSHCSVCKTVINAQTVIPAKGHKEVTDAAVAATCTETGLTAGSHCSVCNEVIKTQEVVKVKGHTEVTDAAVAATCTKTGLTEGSHCSVCGEVLKVQETVPAKGHTAAAAVKENEKAAKVGVAGSYDEVVYCYDCGAEISRKTVTVPALPEEKKEEDVKTAETATDKAEITAAAATVDPFDAFCNELARKIRNAPQNGTVEADAGDFPGLKQVVFKALEDRSDVSLKLKTRDGEIVIPAGAGLISKVGTGTVTWAEIRGLV